jgi:hydrogenase maturation protein HypF
MAADAVPVGTVRRRLRIEGVVQGVGFRPFAYGVATDLGLAGFVANDERGVVMEVEGTEAGLSTLVDRLVRQAPPNAVVARIRPEALPPSGETRFSIATSRTTGARHALVAPDVATCEACLRELFDPADRRHRHPFITCNACGPRFTIVRDVPYDRPATSMAPFAPCAACRREYDDPADRRFHAQAIACPACGPRLRLLDGDGRVREGDPVAGAVALLAAGAVVAVKGIGGYHLAVAASDAPAVARLRRRKRREAKPFAVMAADLDVARRLGRVDAAAAALLASPARPIVLVERRADAGIAAEVAPGSGLVGLLLPYTPLHHLLCRAVGAPIVLTSGNVSDEPIAIDDAEALARLRGIADAFLVHDRAIQVRADDSVVRPLRAGATTLRRSRGAAPQPLRLPVAARRPILACGAGLKSTFCLAAGELAFVSPHVGDLDGAATLRAFRDGIEHHRRLFGIDPEVVVHDLHPDYPSTRHARSLSGVELLAVQHHHAHVAACLAEHGERGPAIGIAFDGLGYGSDGTLWGGEVFVGEPGGFRRAAHLSVIAMPGGTAAIRQPWRMAAAYLAALGEEAPEDLPLWRRHRREWAPVLSAVRAGVNAPRTSSVGRLFDAVAALCGAGDACSYEGQAAMALEQLADASEDGAYDAGVGGEPVEIRAGDLVAAVVDDLRAGVDPRVVAVRFHRGVSAAVERVCRLLRDRTGLALVALGGGVFQNALLVDDTVGRLERAAFRVLVPSVIPPNDGGISFGQAAIAARVAGG